eukprot:11375086-Prorocentrum_lima.AAC.1
MLPTKFNSLAYHAWADNSRRLQDAPSSICTSASTSGPSRSGRWLAHSFGQLSCCLPPARVGN